MTDIPPSVHHNKSGALAVVGGQCSATPSRILSFHQRLPQYRPTRLHSLPHLSDELRLGHVLVKDESDRFGLPSFKILGAAWAVYRAVVARLGLDPDTVLANTQNQDSSAWMTLLGHSATAAGLSLVTCTEGNWGRAVARMAKYLDIPTKIFVPAFMPETTRARIRSEDAEIVVVDGSYDDSVAAARREAQANESAILVMDIGWNGYESVPGWVVEGYGTMLSEADAQIQAATQGARPTHAVIPVGCGSIAQAVTQHYKAEKPDHPTRASVITVEPTTAACLKSSLEADQMTSVRTGDSIMCGMNCGTLSSTAWPTLRVGVDADITVTDAEAHEAVCELARYGLQPGPCGAATLAALRRACQDARSQLGLDRHSVVVLFCTEGRREYELAG